MPPTLFITAYDQHALKAFEVHALDYLLKPFSPERFHQALDRARRWCLRTAPEKGPDMGALLAGLRQERPWADRLLVRQGDRHVLVRTSALQWIEAEDNYVRLHVEGTSHLLRQTMSGILARLDPAQFRRIHRSAIVNLDCIKEFQPWTGGDHLVIMRDGTRLTLSRTYRDQVGEWL
jgi:two-component system LytT family response regulator